MGGLRKLWEGVPPTCDLRINGKSLRGLSDAGLVEVRREIGFIFQRHNLIESLTALQNVFMSQELREAPSAEMKARAAALLERLGLGHRLDFKPAGLSGGQRQRVAVARALVNRPKLVLADEPTAALDAKSTLDVMTLLHELAQAGSTIFIVTHDSKIIDRADRIVDMDNGRIVANVLVHERKFIREALRTCPPFVVLDPKELLEIVDQMAADGKPPEDQARILKKFRPGQDIVTQGADVEPDSLFYLIRRGRVAVVRDGATVAELEAGRYFGDVSLVFGGPRNVTVRAVEATEAYTLGQDVFSQVKEAAAKYVRRIREAYNF
jgi:putative ABC transport system ATP-binding protein